MPQVKQLLLANFVSREQMLTSQHGTNAIIKIFRGVDQKIDLLIRDYDRKSVLLEDEEIVMFHVYDKNKERKLFIEAELLNYEKGHYAINVNKAQSKSLMIGDYKWCITIDTETPETSKMLYSNRDYGSLAPLIVTQGPYEEVIEGVDILGDFIGNESQNLMGSYHIFDSNGVQSFVMNCDGFTGNVDILGTIDDTPPVSNLEWANIYSTTLTNKIGTHHIGVSGNYKWLKMVLNNTINIETVDYRSS